MKKAEFLVLFFLILFLVYGFFGNKELKFRKIPLTFSNILMESKVIREEDNESQTKIKKLKALNWLASNIGTLFVQKAKKRNLQEICFVSELIVYVQFMEDGRKKKYLLSLRKLDYGFFPKFIGFFQFEKNTWILEEGEDSYKKKSVDCYLYNDQNLRLRQI